MTVQDHETLMDSYRCSDGTEFAVHSELVRGERRFYWVQRQQLGPHIHQHDLAAHTPFEGSHSRATAQRAARRIARAYDAALAGGRK